MCNYITEEQVVPSPGIVSPSPLATTPSFAAGANTANTSSKTPSVVGLSPPPLLKMNKQKIYRKKLEKNKNNRNTLHGL